MIEVAELGALQIHFRRRAHGRKDFDVLVRQARDVGLYSNLITAGVLLDDARVAALAEAGLDHPFQDSEAAGCDRISGYQGGTTKRACARAIRQAGLP